MVAGGEIGSSTSIPGFEPLPARRRSRAASYLLALSILAWLADLHGLLEQRRLNAKLAAGDLSSLAEQNTPRGHLARAYRLHSSGRLEEALTAYGAVTPTERDVRDAQQFNLANLYLERAVERERAGEAQLAISLIELAKENYRQVLAHDSNAWDARYNLSRALEMLPDVGAVEFDDEIMPERSPRAPQAARAYEGLP